MNQTADNQRALTSCAGTGANDCSVSAFQGICGGEIESDKGQGSDENTGATHGG